MIYQLAVANWKQLLKNYCDCGLQNLWFIGPSNVCFKKTGTKRSSVTLLCFVPVFLKQTLNYPLIKNRRQNQSNAVFFVNGLLTKVMCILCHFRTVFWSKKYLWWSRISLILFKIPYRHSSIYAVNVGTHKKTSECKNRRSRGYLVVLKGRKIG